MEYLVYLLAIPFMVQQRNYLLVAVLGVIWLVEYIVLSLIVGSIFALLAWSVVPPYWTRPWRSEALFQLRHGLPGYHPFSR